MSYKQNRAPSYSVFGVPESQAYGQTRGGLPTSEAYAFRNKQNNNIIEDNKQSKSDYQNVFSFDNFSFSQNDNDLSGQTSWQNNYFSTPNTQTTNNESNAAFALPTSPTEYDTLNTTMSNQPEDNVFTQSRKRQIENELIMNFLDTGYGINRALNGLTFGVVDALGQKLNMDSQMTDYLQLKDDLGQRELANTLGKAAEYGGGLMSMATLIPPILEEAPLVYNSYKIGKGYEKLLKDPYQGNGKDVIARMKDHNGETVVLQRGEAIPGPNGKVIVQGKPLKRESGTERNYGLNKIIRKHDMPKKEVTQLPRLIKNNHPSEISRRGQNVYLVKGKNGQIKISITPQDGENIISSMYYPKDL